MRKKLHLKNDSFFFEDRNKTPVNGFNMYKWVIKTLRSLGVPVQDPCCPPIDDIVPLGFNRATGQDVIFLNGSWVAVETATGATAPGGTTSTTTSTTSTSTTSTTTTIP